MNIKINRETLLKPLSAVSGIVERRHTLPILSNLLLEAKQDKIVLTATDPDGRFQPVRRPLIA